MGILDRSNSEVPTMYPTRRHWSFGFSLIAYLSFGLSLIYLVGFLVDSRSLPVTVDRGPVTPVWQAAAIDVLLIALFGFQHSIMARPWFKRRWTQLVPAVIERSVYVWVSSVVTVLLCVAWRPIPEIVWSADTVLGRLLWFALFAAGFGLLLGASFQIDHFELLGLRQTWSALRGRICRAPEFAVRGLYRLVRHPIYVGWLVLFWAGSRMTIGHLLLAAGMTAYVLLAIRFEERDLLNEHGEAYAAYRKHVPALLPRPRREAKCDAGVLAKSVGLLTVAALLSASAGFAPRAHAEEALEQIHVDSAGRQRSALVYTPAGLTADRLVLMLHGAGGSADRIRRFTAYGLERAAARGRWIVAYPEGVGGTWNDCRKTPTYAAKQLGVDDVRFLVALIEHLRAEHSVDAQDVLVAGFSNGAQMAMRLAIERPDVLGGIAVIAAQLPEKAESICHGDVPALRSLWIKGTMDPFLPSAGGATTGASGDNLGRVLSIGETLSVFLEPWREVRATAEYRLPDTDGASSTWATLQEWRFAGYPIVRSYTLHGSGHVVPQREFELPSIVGPAAGDIDFGEVAAEFMNEADERSSPLNP